MAPDPGVGWHLIHLRSVARRTVGTTKNRDERDQVLPRDLAENLRAWMLRTEGQLLFPDPRGKGYLSNKVLNRWYKELSEEAGVPVITSHGARHTAGSSYHALGASQKAVAELLGHRHVGTTERYTHVRVEQTRPWVEARWAALTRK